MLAFLCLSGHISRAEEPSRVSKVTHCISNFLVGRYDSTTNFFKEVKETGPTRIIWRKAKPEEIEKAENLLPNWRTKLSSLKVKTIDLGKSKDLIDFAFAGADLAAAGKNLAGAGKDLAGAGKDLAVTSIEWPAWAIAPGTRLSGPVDMAKDLMIVFPVLTAVASGVGGGLGWANMTYKNKHRSAADKDQMRKDIQSDFRYHQIQQDLLNHKIDDGTAIDRAAELNMAFNFYTQAANQKPDDMSMTKFSAFLLANPRERLLFDSLAPFVKYETTPIQFSIHKETQIKLIQPPPPGYVLAATTSSDTVPDQEKLRRALIVSHDKINELLNLPRWLDKGPDPEEQASYDQLMKNDYEQKLLQEYKNKNGTLSLERLNYLVSEDASKRADLQIDQIFGVKPAP